MLNKGQMRLWGLLIVSVVVCHVLPDRPPVLHLWCCERSFPVLTGAQMESWTISMVCEWFASIVLIFSCYKAALHKSQMWAVINQPRIEFPNTIHVQDIGYLLCNLEIDISQITNEPDGSEGFLIFISWQINQTEITTKDQEIRCHHHESSKLQKCATEPHKFSI